MAYHALLGVFLMAACAAQGQPPGPSAPPAAEPEDSLDEGPMNNWRLGRLLKKHFGNAPVEGGGGAWRGDLPDAERCEAPPEGLNGQDRAVGPGAGDRLPAVLMVLTDQRANRMRIMMPIREFDPEEVEDLQLALIAMHANYDRALDARYAVHEGVLWSVFIHPLGSLTSGDLANAIAQVQTLRDNTGTTYSSTDLLFGGGLAPPGPPNAKPLSPAEPDRA